MIRGMTSAVFLMGLVVWALVSDGVQAERNSRWEKRDGWQDVPAIFTAMGLERGDWVADVGAGKGYLTVRLARAVGAGGRVFAADVDEDSLSKLRRTVAAEELDNVTAVLSAVDDPRLPSVALDAVVIVNAYHEMDDYESMLTHIQRALKPGGRLVIVDAIDDASADRSRSRQTSGHQIALPLVQKDLERAGFAIVEARDPFVERPDEDDHMWLLVGRRQAATARTTAQP